MFALIFFPWCAFWLIWQWWRLRGLCWRRAFLAAHVICGGLIVLSTEVLGAVHGLNAITLVIFWGAVGAAAFFLLTKYPGAFRISFPGITLSMSEKLAVGAGLCIAGIVGLIALLAPPNTTDAMTYHMSRVAHWLQNGSVDNYPTNIPRQLFYPPFAEYAILQAQIMTMSDRLANVVQWSAMAGSALGVSVMARLLGARRETQILSALFVLTLPMGILQGSSTQNDHVVTLWLVCAAVFVLDLGRSWSREGVALTAFALGLAVLTKGTGLILGIPFVLLALVFIKAPFARKALLLGVTLAAVLAVNAAFYSRYFAAAGDPVKAQALTGALTVERPCFAATMSNAARNVITQLAVPWETWDRSLEGAAAMFHHALGLDPADQNTTFSAGKYTVTYELDEDVAVNPAHMVLVLIAGVLFWAVRPKDRWLWFTVLAVACGALVFCAAVKWQPWISRFHLSLFVLSSPLVLVILARSLPRPALGAIFTVLVLASVPALFWNNTRGVLSDKSMFRTTRPAMYFERDRSAYPVYQKIAEAMTAMDCRDIGLKTDSNGWEYPWWPQLGWPGRAFRIESVGVDNVTAALPYPRGEFHPCAIIAEGADHMPQGLVEAGRPYIKVAEARIFTIYVDVSKLRRP